MIKSIKSMTYREILTKIITGKFTNWRRVLANRLKFWRKKCPECGWRTTEADLAPCGLCYYCCYGSHSGLSSLEKLVHDEVTA